ncbi:acetyl-CoA carboxylase biotin carboxylase subunit [Litchfieldia alkalitelluris]|uniref:acetyl-CoA carboxylase biotin carboxylase subunit n=1 Tax=Litchfieldia alkalitelluris TaxID=304268 RepID=UPI0009980F58|nr:acetyl-CoA carboxylase biotin carboxylase subunit [Litchfieldia alkalitelluris]
MFKKILIANRGEIAVRIIRTCKTLGIKTIAVYSEADSNALHVKMADEAFLIGNPRISESYLNISKILEVAVSSKAEAIHPGYGLLSENAEFARQCEEAAIVFIGPPSHIIEQMGSKIKSRKTMEAAGIPIISGITYPLKDVENAISAASQIGYPIMLKASAGGGGIGIQIARSEDELRKIFSGNQRRAESFFGDGSMFVEQYIENPRHIEIQVIADNTGKTLHLWERECSIQRRHQKVVEEAPSTFLDEETRVLMGETAVKAAKSIGYTNIGTIEFLIDEEKNFYFLEMNTRLQVEHPVTEEITGIDLVAEQIKIAAGYQLTYNQDEVKRDGHAIEVRIYAEDPKTFFPSPGTITKLELPEGSNIRHELAVKEQYVVTPFYDPMIAKLIVKGSSRAEAITTLQEALLKYKVEGIKTNIPMLQAISTHPEYKKGNTSTHFISKYL